VDASSFLDIKVHLKLLRLSKIASGQDQRTTLHLEQLASFKEALLVPLHHPRCFEMQTLATVRSHEAHYPAVKARVTSSYRLSCHPCPKGTRQHRDMTLKMPSQE